MTKSADVVETFVGALGRRDFVAARRVLADQFNFVGPFDSFERPESYLDSLQKLYPIVKKVTVRKTFVDGDDVCLLYDMATTTPVGTAFICEWFTVKNQKIKSIRAVFDARPFAPMFSK
jgi:excinuclease UvrABC nuclease subunit